MGTRSTVAHNRRWARVLHATMVAAGSTKRQALPSDIRIELKSNPTVSPPFRHHHLARNSDGLRSQQQSLQPLTPSRATAAVDEALTPVSKSEARIAPSETVARTTSSALKSRHFFAVMQIRVVAQIHAIGSRRRALIAPVRGAVRSAAAAASPTLRQQTSSRRRLARMARLELLKMPDFDSVSRRNRNSTLTRAVDNLSTRQYSVKLLQGRCPLI